MTDPWAEIVEFATVESQLKSSHGPIFKAAVHRAFNHLEMEVEDIAAVAGLPVFTVQRALLGEATKRESDD